MTETLNIIKIVAHDFLNTEMNSEEFITLITLATEQESLLLSHNMKHKYQREYAKITLSLLESVENILIKDIPSLFEWLKEHAIEHLGPEAFMYDVSLKDTIILLRWADVDYWADIQQIMNRILIFCKPLYQENNQ